MSENGRIGLPEPGFRALCTSHRERIGLLCRPDHPGVLSFDLPFSVPPGVGGARWVGPGRKRFQVVRGDTCHEIVHIHQPAAAGREISNIPIRVIRSQQDVEEGYDLVLDLIERRWEEHKTTWRLASVTGWRGVS
jgi:hypothetical protein